MPCFSCELRTYAAINHHRFLCFRSTSKYGRIRNRAFNGNSNRFSAWPTRLRLCIHKRINILFAPTLSVTNMLIFVRRAPSETRTHTARILSPLPLPLGYWGGGRLADLSGVTASTHRGMSRRKYLWPGACQPKIVGLGSLTSYPGGLSEDILVPPERNTIELPRN